MRLLDLKQNVNLEEPPESISEGRHFSRLDTLIAQGHLLSIKLPNQK